jgi:hypothetical protein
MPSNFATEPRFVGDVDLVVLHPDESKASLRKGHGHGTALLEGRAMAEAETLRQHDSGEDHVPKVRHGLMGCNGLLTVCPIYFSTSWPYDTTPFLSTTAWERGWFRSFRTPGHWPSP